MDATYTAKHEFLDVMRDKVRMEDFRAFLHSRPKVEAYSNLVPSGVKCVIPVPGQLLEATNSP